MRPRSLRNPTLWKSPEPMKVTLATTGTHGVAKGTAPMTDRAARGAQIAQNIKDSTSKEQAVELLTQMRSGLVNRTGLVRLIHTTKTTGSNMAFQSFDKKWGNSTRTLETKAALIAYFELAELDTTLLKAYLNTSITERGDLIRGDMIFRILEKANLKPAPQPNPIQAGGEQNLQIPIADNLPVNIPQPNIIQGGVEQNVPMAGAHSQKPAVASQPPAEQNVGPNQTVVANKPSVHDIDDYDSKGSYAPGRQKLQLLNQPQPPVVSNADLQAGNFAFVPPPTQFTLNEAIDNAGVDFANKQEIGEGGFGQAYQVNRGGETVVLKVPNEQNVNKFPEVTMISLNGKLRLNRTNEVTAAYLKSDKISNVCIPTDFLVHITRAGQSSYEMIPAGQAFKKWALAELQSRPQPTIRIAGSIMPKAPGEELFDQIVTSQLKPDDLQAIAKKSLETLGQFANHGFVHGDIKPENMIYDTAGKQLTFIDTGGLAKISQKTQKLEKHTQFHGSRGVTKFYSHPSTLAGNRVGHEQDFFSMGMTILQSSYITKKMGWSSLANSIEGWKKSADPAASLRANLRSRIGNPSAGSLEDLALRLIEISLEGKDPILPARAKAILTELANHAAVGGPGLPPVDTDSLKPPRNFSSIQSSVEIRQRARGEWNPEDLKNPGELVDGRSKGELVALKIGVNVNKVDERFAQHLEEHAMRELDFFANPGVIAFGHADRVKEFNALANAGPRKIALEGDNGLEIDFSAALQPGNAPDIDARLQARKLPGIKNLADILPAFLSNKFMDGLLRDGSPERNALKDFSFHGGPQTSQKIRILEDGTIRIEASRTRRAAQLMDQSKKLINLDPAKSSVTENVVLELRLQPTSANKPPVAEIVIKDVSYELNLCK